MTILVTGATGKTGRHLIRALRSRGADVRAASRDPHALPPAVPSVRFDWGSPDTWSEALVGVTGLYVVGPFLVPRSESLVAELIAAAPRLRQVTLLSVMGANNPPAGMPVAEWEQSVRAAGPQWTILRPNWFFQNFSEHLYLPALKARGELLAPAGSAAVSFVDCRDVADVAAATLTEPGHAGEVYHLTGPEALTFKDVAARLSRAAGHEIRYPDTTPERMADYLTGLGLPPVAVDWVVGLFDLIRAGVNSPLTDTVERVTGRWARGFDAYAMEEASAWPAPPRLP
jgi:uncharacterized protein YbjT (DUF2867 family)